MTLSFPDTESGKVAISRLVSSGVSTLKSEELRSIMINLTINDQVYIPFLRYSLDYWNQAAYFYFYENSDPAKIFFGLQ